MSFESIKALFEHMLQGFQFRNDIELTSLFPSKLNKDSNDTDVDLNGSLTVEVLRKASQRQVQ